jgi:Glycosyl transferases group 1
LASLVAVGFLRRSSVAVPREMAFWWPLEYRHPGAHFQADQLFGGLRELGLPIELADIPQPPETVVLFRVAGGEESDLVAFDQDDSQDIAEELADRVLVYFKQQYATEGYPQPNIVPAGYMPANKVLYRYLLLLRAIRSRKTFRYDVYGRFGMRYGNQELRRRAHETLSSRTDFRYEGSLFRYPGGPDKVPYRKYLFEVARAKVCVDMPGGGDLCTRLIDYLAVGSCIVKPPPTSRLPIRPIDGVHVVYCASDLSDLGDVCAQLVRDDEEREAIARNARDFFDRYLHRRQLADRYLSAITDAQAAVRDHSRPHSRAGVGMSRGGASGQRLTAHTRRYRETLTRALVLALVVVLTLVALPEALGDRPYDPRPSRVLGHL